MRNNRRQMSLCGYVVLQQCLYVKLYVSVKMLLAMLDIPELPVQTMHLSTHVLWQFVGTVKF